MRHCLLVLVIALLAGQAQAQGADRPSASSSSYRGIWISTPFPSFSIQPGEPVTVDLTVHNAGMPPQKVALGVDRAASGWSTLFLGQGKRVQSVFVAPGDKAAVKLRLDPSGKAAGGTQRFDVVAKGASSSFRLPLELTVGEAFAPRLYLKPELPELRGSPSSDFDFKVAIRNDGGEDATVRVDVQAPEAFRTKVTEEFGAQEVTSVPLKAGEQKNVSIKVTPPSGTKQGSYPVLVRATSGKAHAETQLALDVRGEPRLELTGKDERLSADAEAGHETPIDVLIANHGSAPAQDIKLDSSAPSGWKVSFQPDRIGVVAPDETKTVRALVTPATKAIAGDYMVTLTADSGGTSKSSDFRVTVHTSTLWGVVGILVIAAALVVLVAAMLRYGRR